MKKLKKGWLKRQLWALLQFVINPHFLVCFGVAWMITNGWAYVFVGLGWFFDIAWMLAVGGAYLTFLWLPVSPEKIVTVAIAMLLLRWLFPKDEKTLGLLRRLHETLKIKHKERKTKKRKKKGLLEEKEHLDPPPENKA